MNAKSSGFYAEMQYVKDGKKTTYGNIPVKNVASQELI